MKNVFNFENTERPMQFNREKLLLSAQQNPEQLYYMMDTQYEGIYQAEAMERKRQYGANSFKHVLGISRYKLFSNKKKKILSVFETLYKQKIAVFRKGLHFYAETTFDNIVPGDVIFMSRNDVIPADIRIIFSKDLEVDQSIYTGYTKKVKKMSSYESGNVVWDNITDLPNICFVGSTVMEGLARGVVIGTGEATYFSHLLLM